MKQQVQIDDRKVTLVGTAHVSKESVEEVRSVIEQENPDLVGVELDEKRFDSLKNKTGWKDLDLADAMKQGKAGILFLNLVMSIYQRKMGLEQGITPGQEMLEAVETAEENGIEHVLVDRDIGETLDRVRESLSIFQKVKLMASLFIDESEIDVEELKEADLLSSILQELEDEFPGLYKALVVERNHYMVQKLLENDFDHAVVVIGAAHMQGMKEILEGKNSEIEEKQSATRIPVMKILKYGMPAFIIAGLGYSFYKIGFGTGVDATVFWILSNGILALIGAIAARSHLETWIASFVAAPLTSLDPAIGAGMVAGYVEAKLHPPTVGELEDIVKVENFRQMWHNQAGRILLTFIFVTIGSASATFISAGYILSLIA